MSKKEFEIADIDAALKKLSEENKVVITPAYTITPMIKITKDDKPVDQELYKKVMQEIQKIEASFEVAFVVEPRLSIMTKNEPVDETIKEERETLEKNEKAKSTKA